ncbi:MAG TPA: TraR/DksA C4-type zinc finger protein [bacterium]|nr:TraR/DksA C4-type zinc finger protein [bacterium]
MSIDFSYYRELLLEKKREVEDNLKSIRETSSSSSELGLIGELSSSDDHLAEYASIVYEHENALTVENILRDMLKQIDAALKRIEDGTYGICEVCKKPIGEKRLKAIPYATMCVHCKSLKEKSARK